MTPRLAALLLPLWFLGGCTFLAMAPPEPVEEGEVQRGDPDPDLTREQASDARAYFRWPRQRSTLIAGEEEFAPDAAGFPPDAPPPVILGEEAGREDGMILIGSWNLKGLGPNKVNTKMNPVGGAADNPDRTIGRFVAQYVDNMELAVVALQEVVDGRRFMMEDLKVAMRERGYELAFGDGDGNFFSDGLTRLFGRKFRRTEYCPIFYNPQMIEHIDRRNRRGKVEIMKIDGKSRAFTYATFTVREGVCADDDDRFDFVLTCFHAPRPDQRTERANYYAAIPAGLKGLDWDADVILAGDFNGDPNPRFDPNNPAALVRATAEMARWAPLFADEDGARFRADNGFTNRVDDAGTSVFNENVYDELLWREPTQEDYGGKKVIEYGFGAYFTDPNGVRDKRMQNRISDHNPIWAQFRRCSDTD